MRVSQFLSDQDIPFEEMVHPPAFTAQRLAKYLRISGSRVVKSVLLKGPVGLFLAVLPAAMRVNLTCLTAYFDGPVRLATEEELVTLFQDCEWGAVTPFGRLYGLHTILENSIPHDATIVFGSQRHALAIRMTCRDFIGLENPLCLVFAREQPKPHPKPRAG